MAITNIHPRNASREEIERDFCQGLLDSDDLFFRFHDLEQGQDDWLEANFVNGDVSAVAEEPGTVEMTSSATAGSMGRLFFCNSPTQNLPGLTGANWYMAMRAAPRTTADAQTLMAALSWEPGGSYDLELGVIGAVSTANWALRGSTGNIDSGVAFVLNQYDILRAWRRDGTTYLQINDGTVLSGNVFPDLAGRFVLTAENGTTAAARTLRVDWVAFGGRRSDY